MKTVNLLGLALSLLMPPINLHEKKTYIEKT